MDGWGREGSHIIVAGEGAGGTNVMILSLIKFLLCYFIFLFFNLVYLLVTFH